MEVVVISENCQVSTSVTVILIASMMPVISLTLFSQTVLTAVRLLHKRKVSE